MKDTPPTSTLEGWMGNVKQSCPYCGSTSKKYVRFDSTRIWLKPPRGRCGRKEILTLAWQDETVAGIPEDEIRTLLSEGSAYYKSVCHCLWHASAQIVPNSCRGPDGRDSGALAGQQLAELSFSWWCQSLSLNPANWVELRDWREKVRKVHRPSQLAPCPSLELRHCGFNPPMRHWAQMAPWTKYNMSCNMPNMQHQGRFKEFLEL